MELEERSWTHTMRAVLLLRIAVIHQIRRAMSFKFYRRPRITTSTPITTRTTSRRRQNTIYNILQCFANYQTTHFRTFISKPSKEEY